MNNQEIIANLWYLIDEKGFIFEVRGRMYIAQGSDEEKLKYLHQFTHIDFMIAPSRSLPKNLKTTFHHGNEEKTYNVIQHNDLKILGGEGVLFVDLFTEMENSIASYSPLQFPADPLTVITPLKQNQDGVLMPCFTKSL